jgi:hypothetical protein
MVDCWPTAAASGAWSWCWCGRSTDVQCYQRPWTRKYFIFIGNTPEHKCMRMKKNIRKNGQAMSSRHWIVNWGYYGYCPPGAFLQEPWNTIGTWQIMAADRNMKGRVYFNNRDCKSARRDWSAIVSRLRQTCIVWESIIARREINMICCFQTHIRVCLATVFNSDSR